RASTERGSLAAALRNGSRAATGVGAIFACTRYGSTDSGSSRRAQRRSLAGEDEPSRAWLESREESQGGANASTAAATAAIATPVAARRGRGAASSFTQAAPSSTKHGRPTAGIVQIQSADAWIRKYAAVAKPAVAARSPRQAPRPASTTRGANPPSSM